MRVALNLLAQDRVGINAEGSEFITRYGLQVKEISGGTLGGDTYHATIVADGSDEAVNKAEASLADICSLNPTLVRIDPAPLQIFPPRRVRLFYEGWGPFSGESLCDIADTFRACGFSVEDNSTVLVVGAFGGTNFYYARWFFSVEGPATPEWATMRLNSLAARGWDFTVCYMNDDDDAAGNVAKAA